MSAYRKHSLYRKTQLYRGAAPGIQPAGWNSSAYGTPQINLGVFPAGSRDDVFGTAELHNYLSFVYPPSIAPIGFGTAFISLLIRRLYVAGIDATLWGGDTVTSSIRYVDLAGLAPNTGLYGNAFVSFAVRTVDAAGFFNTSFGNALVDHHHTVAPTGIFDEALGTADVHVPRSFVDLAGLGIAGPAWGDHRVDNHTQYVAPPGTFDLIDEAAQFGRDTQVYLSVRYVQQLLEPGVYDGGVFGNFQTVENKNKVIDVDGSDWPPQLKFGRAEIYNNARHVYGFPFVDFTLWGDTLVAPYVRTIYPQGLDSGTWGSRLSTYVYNAAAVVAPSGWDSCAAGAPVSVRSNLQTVREVGIDQAQIGAPFVAFAIRTVAPYWPNRDPAKYGLTDVELFTRYIAAPGIAPPPFGYNDLAIHFTIIGAKSTVPPALQVGVDGHVYNVTPQLYPPGRSMTDWGIGAVRNQHEFVVPPSVAVWQFGTTYVHDRRQWAYPIGIAPPPISLLHHVFKNQPDPPGHQYIIPPMFIAGDFGSPTVGAEHLDPVGFIATLFGATAVTYMGFSPHGIPPPFDDTGTQFGIPIIPGTQYVDVVGIFPNLVGQASLWPHYIWAPMGYPYAGNSANPVHNEQMDASVFGLDRTERPVFGAATVTLQNRTIYPEPVAIGSVVGIDGRVSTNPQYVLATGTRFTKYGFPLLNGGGQTQFYGFEMSVFGVPDVAHGPYLGTQTIPAPAIDAGAFGMLAIELFNRELLAQGWDAFTTSSPEGIPPDDITNRWTWVSNAYAPFAMPGFDASIFGDTWVSLYVRQIYPEGDDTSIVCDYTLGQFKNRMRVTQKHAVSTHGAMSQVFGVPMVSLGLRTLRVWQSILGAVGVPRVLNVNAVHASGWNTGVFSTTATVDAVEAGKIKQHGDDYSAFGRAIINQAIYPDGWWDNSIAGSGIGAIPFEYDALGYRFIPAGTDHLLYDGVDPTHSVASAIGPAGFNSSSVNVPAAIARWCGNKAMAVQGADSSAFGTATIT